MSTMYMRNSSGPVGHWPVSLHSNGSRLSSLICRSGTLVRRRSYRSAGKQAPIVTNTTLTVCRLFGMCVCLSVYLFVCMSVCLCACLPVCLSVCLSVCVLSAVCLSVCVCPVTVSVCDGVPISLLCCVVGNYMQMMIVLKPIAFDVVIYMTQLFDYYLYSVNICFHAKR